LLVRPAVAGHEKGAHEGGRARPAAIAVHQHAPTRHALRRGDRGRERQRERDTHTWHEIVTAGQDRPGVEEGGRERVGATLIAYRLDEYVGGGDARQNVRIGSEHTWTPSNTCRSDIDTDTF
jgi:hypothetical protein